MRPEPGASLPPEIIAYYQQGKEAARLFHGIGQLEYARTQEIVHRCLPNPPAVVYDVGGGPGPYAVWLAGLGYEVHLVDATPLHYNRWDASNLRTRGPHGTLRLSRQQDR